MESRVKIFGVVSFLLFLLNKMFSLGLDILHLFSLLFLFLLSLFIPLAIFPEKKGAKGQLQRFESTIDFDSIPSHESLHQIYTSNPTSTSISASTSTSTTSSDSDPDETAKDEPIPTAAAATAAAAAAAAAAGSSGESFGLDSRDQPLRPVYADEDEQRLQSLLETIENPQADEWKPLLDTPTCKIFRSSQAKYRFKLEAELHNSVNFCFKVMTDERNWKMENIKLSNLPAPIKEAREVEELDSYTKLVYVHTRGIWPVEDRDILLRLHKRALDDGRMVAVATSAEHPSLPMKKSPIRIKCNVSGAIFSPVKGDPEKCYVIQVSDGDPQGWIPETLINLISTQVIPQALWVINKLIRAAKARRGRSKKEIKQPETTATQTKESFPSAEQSSPTRNPSKENEAISAVERPKVEERESGILAREDHPSPMLSGLLKLILPRLEIVRRGLAWASPFILAFLYFLVFFRLFKRSKK